jgi:PiT family inorganic phosphate transporter
MIEWVLIAAVLLAFVNGANDNMKGVATLYGSGALSYRAALGLATVSTALGSLVSLAVGSALVRAFSGKGLVPDALLSADLLTAVGLAAALTVLLATRLGFPISTTHALVGALAGAGWCAAGSHLELGALGSAYLLPLIASPGIALGLAWMLARTGSWLGKRGDLRREPGNARADSASGPPRASRHLHFAHLVSAGAVGFARGLNDTPKILGLVLGAGAASSVSAALLVTAAMAVGGIVAARRVTETLAIRITPMTTDQGFAANLATSLIVIGASRFGLPVSTTHVSTGGIFGIGVPSRKLRWAPAASVVGAWIVTLPIAATLGVAFAALLLRS